MPSVNASRAKRRARLELALRVAAPLLDLALIVGDRVSRVLAPGDPGYVTPRMPSDSPTAPRALRWPPPERPPAGS